LEKIDEQHRNDILKNIVFSWINDKIEHRCLALQLFILFIEIEHEQFDQYLVDIFDFIEKELNNIQSEEDHDEQEKFNDQYIYHLINVLIYVIKYCSNSMQMVQLRSKWLQLLKLIDEKCLLHPHIWIRLISAQFFGLVFETNKPEDIVPRMKKYLIEENQGSTTENGPSPKRLKKSALSNLDQEPLFLHYATTFDSSISPLIKIQRLCLCSCAQLKPSGLTEEFCLQITKNLIYLSKLLLLSNSNHIDLVIRRCCRLTTFESTKYPNEITRRSSILKWMAALVLDLSSLLTSHLKSFLTVIEREETTIHLPLKTLGQDVFDVFKRHCDIHLITSIYADIAKQRRTKRLERKQKLAILAINQPEVIYRKKRVKQTKRLGLGKKKRMKAIENAKKNRRKKVMNKTNEDMDDF
jgi:U3 small nucleolar RNA-associated protein 20